MRKAIIIAAASALLSSLAIADVKHCILIQPCPIMYCPYIESNDNAFKKSFLTVGCQEYAESHGLELIGYVPGGYPRCKVLKVVETQVDCSSIQLDEVP
jgi:hypothetical protein